MMLKRFLIGTLPITIPLIVLVVVWLVARRIGWVPKRKALPASARAGSLASRIAETLVLLCIGAAMLVFTATNGSTGGRLLILDELRPEFATVNLVVAGCAFAGLVIAVLVCVFWRTWAGVVLMATVLSAYGLALNGPRGLLESLTPETSAEAPIPCTVEVQSIAGNIISGVDLWVNGVYLGKTPVKITLAEFRKKVPYWPDPPAEMDDDDNTVIAPEYDETHVYNRRYPKWIKFVVAERRPRRQPSWRREQKARLRKEQAERRASPETEEELPKYFAKRRARREAETQSRTYYAQVKLNGHWGGSYQRGGLGGGGFGDYIRPAYGWLREVYFPENLARVEKMLDKARLADYKVDSKWYEAMETFGHEGWDALLKAVDKEPAMKDVRDGWAIWKYGLDKVTNEKSAWQVFETICAEAEQLRKYSTASVTGRAVDLLVQKLDPQRLAKRAVKIARRTRGYSWYHWQQNGRLHFGYSDPPGRYYGHTSGSYGIGGPGERLSPAGFVVAHAVWLMDKLLDSQDDSAPNIIESKVVPEIVCWNYNKVPILRIAAHLGGSVVEQFAYRQKWYTEVKSLPWGQKLTIGLGTKVNGWAYILATIDSPGGRRFRREHSDKIFEIADLVVADNSHDLSDNIDFMFSDLDLGKESLAARYWPKFKAFASRSKGSGGLQLKLDYLGRMEPVSTTEMYVEAWRDFRGDDGDAYSAFDILKRTRASTEKKELIFDALSREIERSVENIEDSSNEERLRRSLLAIIKGELFGADEQRRAKQTISLLKSDKYYTAESIAAWLEHTVSDHPLVKILAESDEAEFRLIVMGALRAHPTPENRAILEKLLRDNDADVRSAAGMAAGELKALADIPLAELADKSS